MVASATNCALDPHVDCSMQHGHDSAFEPGAYGLPYYCTPPVCVPVVLGGLSVWPCHHEPASAMPENVNVAKPPNKEKSYKKYLESKCSDQWRKHVQITLSDPPGRVRAYVHWYLHNKHKRSMYKPAPYLTHPSCPTNFPSPSVEKRPKGMDYRSNSTLLLCACMSPPYIQLLWICPLIIMPQRRQIAIIG